MDARRSYVRLSAPCDIERRGVREGRGKGRDMHGKSLSPEISMPIRSGGRPHAGSGATRSYRIPASL